MRYWILTLLIITGLVGCSNGSSPVANDLTEASSRNSSALPTVPCVWGFWDIAYNHETSELSIIPLRTADGTWNVTMFLQPPAGKLENLGVQILDATQLVSAGRLDVRVSIHHPFPSAKLRGFDVRGVVMGNGSITDTYNTNIKFPGLNDLRLLNADGYTRWMNASEFTVKGILGYTPGALASKDFTPTATINGYKYFAELIDTDQSVFDYFASSPAFVTNRGSITPGLTIARDYELKFPTSPLQVKFQYAILANWEKATSGGYTPSPLDFPNEANAFEPLGLKIDDSSTLYMESPTKKGGNIDLKLSFVDWWCRWDPEHLTDYISKIVLSSNHIEFPEGASKIEFNLADLDLHPTSAWNAKAVNIFIADVIPSGTANQEVLISIETNGYNYTNPFGVPNSAGNDPLTGYFLYTFTVSPDFNDPPVITSGVDGNPTAFIMDTKTYTVTAVDDDSPTLTYEWTVHDPLTQEILYGPLPGNGTGSWEAEWPVIATPGEVEIHCTVSDGMHFVQAEPLTVRVSDVIFHANLNDTATGGNAGWTKTEEQGISRWSDSVGQDNVLQGYGYKFGLFNAIYLKDSSGILVSPKISIPDFNGHAFAVVFHSYQWEYYAPLEVGFDGSNFKCTKAPSTPTFNDPEIPIAAGYPYEGWLFDTAISDQMAFYSDKYPDRLLVSAFEIPPAFLGSDIHLGFAAATNYFDYAENHGWLIDDVQIRALPEGANAPPLPGSPVTGDTLVAMLPESPGEYEVSAFDLEDDPLHYAWTVRSVGTSNIVWGPETVYGSNKISIDWSEVGAAGDYDVHVSIYDGYHPGMAAQPLTVTALQPIFHADFADTVTGGNAGWAGILESGATSWTTTVGSDSYLQGYGYKWGNFNSPYQPNSAGILLSPAITLPSGISRASIFIRHDFDFIATLDGGNFKIALAPQTPNFSTAVEPIDGGVDYDSKLNGTVMHNQKAFGIGVASTNGMLSRMDLPASYFGHDIRLGIAVASGTTFFSTRGWLIDDVIVAVK